METSILLDVKKYIGIDDSYTVFDDVILSHINTVIFILKQLGIGSKPFIVSGEDETWIDYIPNIEQFPAVRTYVQVRTKMLFENITNSTLLQSLNDTMNELSWRLNVEVDA